MLNTTVLLGLSNGPKGWLSCLKVGYDKARSLTFPSLLHVCTGSSLHQCETGADMLEVPYLQDSFITKPQGLLTATEDGLRLSLLPADSASGASGGPAWQTDME